jgi:hypothetical protein
MLCPVLICRAPKGSAPTLDERGAAEKLRVAGGVGEGQAGPRRQILDAALALPKMFEQFEPMRVAERQRDLRKTGKCLLFRSHP